MTNSGEHIGRYQLLNTLGRGGFATVYRALDTGLDREVAVKVLGSHLAEDDRYRTRFLTEARLMARMRHPNIVTVYDVGETNDRPFFAMELIEGDTLADLLAYGEQLPPEQVAMILRGLCAAVDYLHAASVIHRDIKAANVMVEPAGRAVLMDFGIARMLDDVQLTQSGAVMGTPEAMAPEQARGEPAGTAADIYALGVLAYRMLAGRPPFVGNTAAVLRAHAFEEPVSLRVLRPGLPAGIYAAVATALAKDPVQRPPTAATLANAMERALEPPGTPPAGVPLGYSPPVRPVTRPSLQVSPDDLTVAGPPLQEYDATALAAPHTLRDIEPVKPADHPAQSARKSRLPLLAGAAVAIVVAVAAAAIFALHGRSGGNNAGVRAIARVPATPVSVRAERTTTAATLALSPTPGEEGSIVPTATVAPTSQSTSLAAAPQPEIPAPALAGGTAAPPAGPLGDLDLRAYCQGRNATLQLRIDNSWACHNADGSVTTVDLNAACRAQFAAATAIAQQKPGVDPPAFSCLTP